MSRFDDEVMEATDLSPILNVNDDQRRWLSELAMSADAAALSLRLRGRASEDIEPVVTFEESSGVWWAGRFIGEIQFQGRTLRIMPRFGMPQLHRWLFRISGVRLISSKGKYETSRIWLWELLAKLWEAQLLSAAKHGLPTVRVDEYHAGQSIRGRLDVPQTAKMRSKGIRVVVSRPRNRRIDSTIGGVIVHALGYLRRALQDHGGERSWLTERGYNIVKELCVHISMKDAALAADSKRTLRYTPITEGYRQVVELSRAIARQRPSSSTAMGRNEVIGVLIDMAELWELYVFHVLRSQLSEYEVVHTGRNARPSHWLLQSEPSGKRLGGLLPDIMVLDRRTTQPLAVLDAKYKSTTPRRDRPNGILREDLYQMTAYLSALGTNKSEVVGGLIYPITEESAVLNDLGPKSPWLLPGVHRRLWFFSLKCGDASTSDNGDRAEQSFASAVIEALKPRTAAAI